MSYIPLLPKDEHIVVTLSGPNLYAEGNYRYINLGKRPVKDILSVVLAIRGIIAREKIDIVHSHSYWTNILSRLATRKRIKLINHYHFADYDTMKHIASVRKMIWLDRITTRKTLTRVAVSDYVARILNETFPGSQVKVIRNFIECRPNGAHKPAQAAGSLKVVAVGNCNIEKNYSLVLQAFGMLKDEPITLEIIGGGQRLEFYRGEVTQLGLSNVRFCGTVASARDHLSNYDLFLSASISETFGIAVLEGVCARLSLLISDIPAFHEIAPKGTVFFNPKDAADLARKLRDHLREPVKLDCDDCEKILARCSSGSFLEGLKELYNS